jgi:hypothetical protein
VVEPVDVTFEVIWRSGGSDHEIFTLEQHFEPRADDPSMATAYEQTAEADKVDASEGDELVFRFSGESANDMAYIPNGEGTEAGGRIPYLDLPPD